MMVQEKCDLYKLEIYGLNQTSYSNNLLVELKQYLRNDLKLKFSNLEYNPQSQATVIFFQYKSDYDSARHVFSRKVQWRTFHFSIDSKPVEKSPTCDKKLVVPSPTSSEEKKPDPSSVAHSNNNGTKEQTSQKLEEYIQTNVPLLSVPYETQLKGKQEHVLSTYANLFKQYINFKQLHTFQTFMRTKYGEGRPFMFGGVVPSPGPDEEEGEWNMLELSVGTDVETNAISVGFPISDDPNLKTPVQVIPLRDVYNRHCFNIPKKFVTATEIIEKIIRSSGLQISSNSGNSMGVWHQVCYRLHSKITGAGTINEKVTPQLMIIFQIRPGYKLTPEIIDYISDIILDEVLSQNTVQSLGLLIQYNTKIEKVLFVTDSAHNLNSNLVVQCIPYVMTQVGCMDSLPHSHLYDVMILFERLEPNVSHDQVQLGFKFNDKLRLIEQSRVEAARLETERQETLARLRAEAKQAAAEAKQAAAEAKQAAAAAPVPTSAEVKSEVKETPVSGATNNHIVDINCSTGILGGSLINVSSNSHPTLAATGHLLAPPHLLPRATYWHHHTCCHGLLIGTITLAATCHICVFNVYLKEGL
ncbi:uncharacterized protein LOC103511765 [Diaphorina citri]|uniref:Uncharacterized protein LOC103511765 n=1 Tax=Diaphorina citri TaxID=121845 RepID=A0A3Q0J3B9_DIACI|nr:uncharacterized protein LOC103511765 [Diaphorina citri]